MKTLVAGIGNVFLGDDGFGVEVARRLSARPQPEGVRVADFGVRGFDLALALLEPYERVILIDVARRGGRPGTLYLLEAADGPEGPGELEPHAMVPSRVLRTARSLGAEPGRVLIVACEPEDFGDPEEGRMGLRGSVEGAVDEAVRMVESLVRGEGRA